VNSSVTAFGLCLYTAGDGRHSAQNSAPVPNDPAERGAAATRAKVIDEIFYIEGRGSLNAL
jgi:hypothetical protein